MLDIPIINGMSTFVNEDHMLDWHLFQICYSHEIKLLLLLFMPEKAVIICMVNSAK